MRPKQIHITLRIQTRPLFVIHCDRYDVKEAKKLAVIISSWSSSVSCEELWSIISVGWMPFCEAEAKKKGCQKTTTDTEILILSVCSPPES